MQVEPTESGQDRSLHSAENRFSSLWRNHTYPDEQSDDGHRTDEYRQIHFETLHLMQPPHRFCARERD
jgi:hypothetical protein